MVTYSLAVGADFGFVPRLVANIAFATSEAAPSSSSGQFDWLVGNLPGPLAAVLDAVASSLEALGLGRGFDHRSVLPRQTPSELPRGYIVRGVTCALQRYHAEFEG